MAEIRRYPFVNHLRADPTSYVIRFRNGRIVSHRAGASFWFRPLSAALAEVPVDDRELQFHFSGRSSDFQEISVQGALTYRVAEPETVASRIDFSIDPRSGCYVKTPLEQLAQLLTQIAHGYVVGYLVATPLQTLITTGVREVDRRLRDGFASEPRLAEIGLVVSAVTVLAVRPTLELERALQTPELERIQQFADRATFERRAAAVEQERAIAENEMANRIEIARREQELVEQETVNARARAESEAEETEIAARAEARWIEAVEAARVNAERERMTVYAELPPSVLTAVGIRELARNLPQVEHLTVTPDLVTPLLGRLRRDGEAA